MADIADQAGDLIEATESLHIARARKAVADMPVGSSGECKICEEHYARIVNGICCRCRDELKL